MKAFSIFLLVAGAVSAFVGTMILTASHRPPQWASWTWQIAGREVHLNQYAFWWYTQESDGGFWDTMIPLRQWPRVQVSFMSKEQIENQKRSDWQSDEYMKEATRLRAISDRKFWTWPDLYGLMPRHRS